MGQPKITEGDTLSIRVTLAREATDAAIRAAGLAPDAVRDWDIDGPVLNKRLEALPNTPGEVVGRRFGKDLVQEWTKEAPR